MWTFSWKRRSALGVDVGGRTIRVLHLRRMRRGYRVEGFGEHELPPGAVQDKRIKDPDVVVGALRSVLSGWHAARWPCVVSIPASLVMTRQLEFPAALSEAELELHVRLEAERQLPFPSTELALDFLTLPSPNPFSTNVTLAACRRDHVDERVAVLQKADCRPSVVAMEVQVVERAFRVVSSASVVSALVYLESDSFTLYLMRDGRVVHWREQSVNWQGAAISPDAANNEFERDSMTVVPHLAALIQRSLHLMQSASDQEEVEQLWLSGIGAARPGLAENLCELLGLPVSVANVLHNFSGCSPLAEGGPRFFMAAGMALRGVDGD